MRGEKMNAFSGENDLQAVSDEIYGKSEIPDSGRVVARPTPIDMIWADVKQPRRAIPLSIRMHWDGNPASVPELLNQWRQVATQSSGEVFDMVELLNGEGEGLNSDNFNSLTQEFLALVRLAAGIKADGLINPITIVESDGKLLIESGERRWLAYHLLNVYLGETWAKIPAAKGNGSDSVWRQATENTQRRQLNPIGMARQIGLLIMDAREKNGESYLPYEDIVRAGVSDRRFYAQVADGQIHRIPKGMGERIQSAMGLSMEQLARYRALLRLTDDEMVNDVLWTRADVENWAEGALREIATLPIGKVSEVLKRSQWTLDDLKALKDVPVSLPPGADMPQVPVMPVASEWMGKDVRHVTRGISGKVVDVYKDNISIRQHSDNARMTFKSRELVFMAPVKAAPPAPTYSVPGFDHDFRIGDKVRTRTGAEGEVVGLSGRLVTVRTMNGTNAHDHSVLTKIERTGQPVYADAPFIVGDQVVTKFGRVLTVKGFSTDGKLTKVNGSPNEPSWSIPTVDLKLYEEPQIDEDDIEADVDPDVQPPARQWREGGPEEGANNEAASDKADSVAVSPKLLFPMGTDDWGILDAFNDLALLCDDADTSSTLSEINNMTDLAAIRLHQAEALRPKLDKAYDDLKAALDDILNVQFVAILQKVMDVAVK